MQANTTNDETIKQASIEVKNELGARLEQIETSGSKLEAKMDKIENAIKTLSERGMMGFKSDTSGDKQELIEFKNETRKAIESKTQFVKVINPSMFEKKDVNRMDVDTLGGFLNRIEYESPRDITIKSDITKLLNYIDTRNLAFNNGQSVTFSNQTFKSGFKTPIEKRAILQNLTKRDASTLFGNKNITASPYAIEEGYQRHYFNDQLINGQEIAMQSMYYNFNYILSADIIKKNVDHTNIEGISDILETSGRVMETKNANSVSMRDLLELIKKIPSSVLGDSVLIMNINTLIDIWSEESGIETYKNFELFENGNLKTIINNIPIIGVDSDVLPQTSGETVAILGNIRKAYKLYRSASGRFVMNQEFEQVSKDMVEVIYEEVIGGGLIVPELLYSLKVK